MGEANLDRWCDEIQRQNDLDGLRGLASTSTSVSTQARPIEIGNLHRRVEVLESVMHELLLVFKDVLAKLNAVDATFTEVRAADCPSDGQDK